MITRLRRVSCEAVTETKHFFSKNLLESKFSVDVLWLKCMRAKQKLCTQYVKIM